MFFCALCLREVQCFSGCQDCLAFRCKQIAAFILFSQHLTSPVIQLKVLACTVCSYAAIQVCCDADAGVKLVELLTVTLSEFKTGTAD